MRKILGRKRESAVCADAASDYRKGMQALKVTITGRKVNLRENFKELAQKKLSRFDRIFDEDAQAKVVVTLERNRQTV